MVDEPNKNGNGKITISWHWLAVTLLPITIALIAYVYSMANAQTMTSVSQLNTRLSSDEQTMQSQGSDITQIKSDVSYIKGLLQQRWGISPNQ